jgi:septal ring factor EnvC (AmiA/AmiB activator)
LIFRPALLKCLALMCACLFVESLFAQTEEQKAINAKQKTEEAIKKTERDLLKKEQERRRAEKDLKKSDKQLQSINKKLKKLGTQQTELVSEIEDLTRQIDNLEEQKELETKQLAEIVKQQFFLGVTHPPLISGQKDLEHFGVQSVYRNKIMIAQSTLLDRYADRLKRIDRLTTTKLSKQRQLEKNQKLAKTERNRVQQQHARSANEIKSAEKGIAADEKRIKRLRDDMKRLSDTLEAIERRRAEEAKQLSRQDQIIDGKRFAKLKGKLRLPTAGNVTTKFGQARTSSGLTWQGIFISAKYGTPVVSIEKGVVVHADWLRGFGNLVIIDHGEGFYSLYGNNRTIIVEEGQTVYAGTSIGTVGNSGGLKEPGSYFEIRIKGVPVDPLGWVNIGG